MAKKSLRYVPPAGHPISLKKIFYSLFATNNSEDIRKQFKEYLKVNHIFFVSSGTAALYLILKSISHRFAQTNADDKNKNEVIIPAYTCPSVAAAAIKAGLKPILCDLSDDYLGLNTDDLNKKISHKTLCVVFVELFGIYGNILEIQKICKKKDILLIEDSAQSFGNRLKERYLGTIGDIGFYSFGRGKPLSVVNGGAIVTNSERLAVKIKEFYQSLSPVSYLQYLKILIQTLLYSIFFHPMLYWIPQRIPFLKLGETIFSLKFDILKMNQFSLNLLKNILNEMPGLRKDRINNTNKISETIKSNPNSIKILSEKVNKDPNNSFIRLPILISKVNSVSSVPSVAKNNNRDILLKSLIESGIGATGQYPTTINKLDGVNKYVQDSKYPNAEYLSKHIITLPIHSLVSTKDINTIKKSVKVCGYRNNRQYQR